MKALAFVLVTLPLLVACGATPPPTDGNSVVLPGSRGSAPLGTTTETPTPASKPLTTSDKAPGDGCRALPGWKGDVAHRGPSAPPVAGQMTEAAAQAKRLFDAEKWPEASSALGRVAAGDTHDDDGNRQLADYFRAVALYQLKKHDEAAARFRVFSHNPSHLEFQESLLWIVRITMVSPSSVALDDVALYTPAELARFDNVRHQEIYGRAAYMLGHQRYDEGNVSEAKELFEAAKRVGPWSREAEVCLGKIAKAMPRR